MQEYLVFRIYGAMVSWGKIAVGGERQSYAYPTKSAIIGLIAAALGIQRSEEKKLLALQNSFGFAVRIDNRGTLILDYHTTQVPSKNELKKRPHLTRRDETLVPELNTILSTREYYCDAAYSVVLWQRAAEAEFPLPLIPKALQQPKFVLYLGRKSCPVALPLKAEIYAAETIMQALKSADSKFRAEQNNFLRPLKKHQTPTLPLYWDKDGKIGSDSTHSQLVRKDALLSRQRWQYQDREECYHEFSFEEPC